MDRLEAIIEGGSALVKSPMGMTPTAPYERPEGVERTAGQLLGTYASKVGEVSRIDYLHHL